MKKDYDVKKVIDDFGDIEPTEEQLELIGDLADEYLDKSEDDIFVEIIRVNEKMESEMDPEEYEAIFNKLESIRPFLDEEQQAKLDKILKALGRK